MEFRREGIITGEASMSIVASQTPFTPGKAWHSNLEGGWRPSSSLKNLWKHLQTECPMLKGGSYPRA